MFGAKNKKSDFVGKRIYSIEEYLEIEARLPEVYEFWDGLPIRLNLPDFFFRETVTRLEKILSEAITEKNFKVFSNFFLKKKKVWIKSENCLFYPDLFVVGDKIDYYPEREDIITNPLMTIECSPVDSMGSINGVTGDRTYLTDRTTKFWKYQKIPSLREYILIADNGAENIAETYIRLNEHDWKYRLFSKKENDFINFESIDLKFPIKTIYL